MASPVAGPLGCRRGAFLCPWASQERHDWCRATTVWRN
ncbi:protein of unassigned function [Methylobacterium oryzae CBMB20]|uniref:Protein of unassigned function n=1 Tax=Methylobacterium oryzae CBMB20 TaxID=693986 RepID=A0A089NUU5_9HYPH|nr:protein of unassigned function [Methylobacterium oryzae CBMB20]